MRSLVPAPGAFVDPATGAPAFGSYAGPLPRVDLGNLGLTDRIARRKRWFYVALASEEAWISLAIVRTGYATTAFAFAFDLAARRMLFDRTVMAPPTSSDVAADPHEDGRLARFSFGASRADLVRKGSIVEVKARFGELEVDASVDETGAPPAISAIARLDGRLPSATEKRALAGVRGRATLPGRLIRLDGGIGGYDYTHGLLPRHTRWRWAFAMGRAATGEPVAFNVVEGFVGEAECAAFCGRGIHAIAEPRFVFDAGSPDQPWRLVADGMDLVFSPGAVHRQYTDLVLVRSRFVQPVGTFHGVLRVGGRDLTLANVPGVVEDQDVLW